MSFIKIITTVNWVLVSTYGAYVLYYLLQANGSTDAAGQGQESAIKWLLFFLVIILAGLNLLPYTWTKIVALLIEILLFLLFLSLYSN